MALEIRLNQKLTQSLVMTPQLQQAIKLLQLGRTEYLEVIEKELLENPVLEDARDGEDGTSGGGESVSSLEGASGGIVDSSGFDMQSQQEDSFVDSEADTTFQRQLNAASAQIEQIETGYGYARSSGSFEDGERPSFEATLCRPEGLLNHIIWQLRTSDLPHTDYDIAILIIGNLDRNGYLCCSMEEVVQDSQRSIEDIEQVLSKIQTLDPPGIGARNLGECLLIQLEQLGLRDSLAARIVELHLPKLETRRYDLIAKEEGLPVEAVFDAVRQIQRLEPHPGRPFFDDAPVYITPDIYVRKVGDDYVIALNEVGMPKLRLNDRYRSLISGEGKLNGEKDYLQDRIRSASWFIKSVHQRQQTIFKVTECIVKYQREFLEKGVAFLKPMVLRDVADIVGMHESTVSRVTTNKYVHTPQGVFELKFFFSSGLKSGDGEVSSESVKERIKTLVGAENAQRPLSDQQLVEILKGEGIDIARRTVAKYREVLGIESSSRRKRMF